MGTVAVGNLSPDWNLQVCLPHTMNVVVQWRIQGGAPVRAPPPPPYGTTFSQFHAVFGNLGKNYMLVLPAGGFAPPPREILDPPLYLHKEFYLDVFCYVLTDLKSVQCEHVLPSGFESESVPEFVSGNVNKPLGYLYSERNF